MFGQSEKNGSMPSLRAKVHRILEIDGDLWNSHLVTRLIVIIIVINLTAVCLESVPEYAARWPMAFFVIETASVIIFTLEYALRLWSAGAVEPERRKGEVHPGLRFARSPAGLVDLVAILPFWLAFVVPGDFRVLLVVRMLRFLKLARYSPAMQALFDALYAERRALMGCVVILMGASLFAATAMHLAERDAQPDKLGTIPDALWWAIVTLGTVGYGDVVPITPLGRLIATATILVGLIIMALPIGIIASAFAQQVHRRDFVVTWTMISRVPLFAGLSATNVGDIIKLLVARRVEAGEIIARRGEHAESMFFIVKGEVEIVIGAKHVRLGAGHFFGEIALLQSSRRTGTSIARSSCNLLILEARDLHALMDRDERIAAQIKSVARSRLGRELDFSKGDLSAEELEESFDERD